MPLDPLPPASAAALLLDLDGTLLDIAPAPGSVVVPPGLIDALLGLRAALGDALAIVTGRPIEQVDALLPGVPYAIAGEHGGALRRSPGTPPSRPTLPELPPRWRNEAARIAAAHPGALLEPKQRGFVLHYRAVPEAGPSLRAAAARLIEPHGHEFQLLPALMAWEIRPRGADKGTAVQALMSNAPFAGRQPIFIGDDVTDEDGMVVARSLEGAGFQVEAAFGNAQSVRTWLAASALRLSNGEDWPQLPRARL